jgi:hypothetical protein
LKVVVHNFIWPLKFFGIRGCVFGLVYWPLVMPPTFFVCILYMLPLPRMYVRYVQNVHERISSVMCFNKSTPSSEYQVAKVNDDTLDAMKIEHLMKHCSYCSHLTSREGGSSSGMKDKCHDGSNATKESEVLNSEHSVESDELMESTIANYHYCAYNVSCDSRNILPDRWLHHLNRVVGVFCRDCYVHHDGDHRQR